MTSSPQLIEVAVSLHLDRTFHYLVPPTLVSQIMPGKRVFVPFGRRKLTGYVLGPATPTDQELKEIVEVLDEQPLFTPAELEFFRWVATYYHYPLGQVIKSALPAGINIATRKKLVTTPEGITVCAEVLTGGRSCKTEAFYRPADAPAGLPLRGKAREIHQFLVAAGEVPAPLLRQRFGDCAPQLRRLRDLQAVIVDQREVYRDPFREEVFERDTPRTLTLPQAHALAAVAGELERHRFAPFLLHGVTGSGKTEVYLQTIARAIELGKTALVLVPEISLTPQLVKRFKQRFACGIAVLHSALSEGERFDEWRRIRRGEVEIVIGARSAIFAPLQRIGIIVVDEEHDSSYKQAEGLRYNARDLALVRGKMARAAVILGSATPLVTTFFAAQAGKLLLLPLPERVRDLPMPLITLVDTRGQRGEPLSPQLKQALADNLAAGGQSLLFLNRRGFATFLICDGCGHVFRCPNCAVTLTYHQQRRQNICHYCDYTIPAPTVCPACDTPEVSQLGHGTERLEVELQALWPAARISRMDRDTTTGKGGHARVLKALEEGKIDILIGTQMIAKGHDFPGVTLVGAVSADSSLNLPDFRSGERTFQLLVQVAGRAGRGDRPGQVIIQSHAPDHYALQAAACHDYAGFYQQELEFRRELAYPPFSHLAALDLSATSAAAASRAAAAAADALREIKRSQKSRAELLGPAPAPLARLRGRYRWQILLKAASRPELHRLIARFRGTYVPPSVVRLHIDVDPVDML